MFEYLLIYFQWFIYFFHHFIAAKLTGKQVFISCSLPEDRMLMPLVEKRLHEELQTNPDKF